MIHYCRRAKTSPYVHYFQMYKRIFQAFLVSNTYIFLTNMYGLRTLDSVLQCTWTLANAHIYWECSVLTLRYGRYILGKVVLTTKGQRHTHTHPMHHNSVNLAYWHSWEMVNTFYGSPFYSIILYTEDTFDNWPKPVKVAWPRVCFLAPSHTD